MGIPRMFDDIIKRHLNVNAAWLPITNNYTLGDYGIITDGVFAKLGNIQEFNVPFTAADGPDASIDFTSANTTVIKFAAGAQVDVIPEGAIDAKITFKFGNERSFMVKAPVIKVSAIQNVNQVAIKLRDTKNWGRRWKVVYQVYNAHDPLLVSTITANTELTLSGNAEALRKVKVGDASLELGTTKELGLNVHGKAGIIGLGLFKLKTGDGGPKVLGSNVIQVLDNKSPLEEDL
jgi:hypothetical protein